MESNKKKQIDTQINKLNSIFEELAEDKKQLVEGLIQNAAFMHVTLLELQHEVLEHGAMIEAVSGNGFKTIKDNPAQKAYTTMISRYLSIIDQLNKMMPEVANTDELLEFLKQ